MGNCPIPIAEHSGHGHTKDQGNMLLHQKDCVMSRCFSTWFTTSRGHLHSDDFSLRKISNFLKGFYYCGANILWQLSRENEKEEELAQCRSKHKTGQILLYIQSNSITQNPFLDLSIADSRNGTVLVYNPKVMMVAFY